MFTARSRLILWEWTPWSHHQTRRELRKSGQVGSSIFDDNPGRRSINNRMSPKEAEEAAKALARVERDNPKW